MKEVVKRHSKVIESITNSLKSIISHVEDDLTDQQLLELVENTVFASEYISVIEYCDIAELIKAIFLRVSSKYSILSNYLEDIHINEIMANGAYHIFVEKNKQIIEVDNAFYSDEELEGLIRMFASDVHREINEANPIVDARLENGYRVNGVLKNVALNGPILTIRKFANDDITLDDLVKNGTMPRECSEFLSKLVTAKYNVFISGGTSSGKTTFLNALSSSINSNERVIIIEDSAELKVSQIDNIVHMECRNANSVGKGRVSMEMLIKTSLRMRPDRIIVGEVRGREVIDMIQAMSTGHDGSMSTGHGNSIKGMLNRLETMYLMDTQIPIYSIKSQIANAIDIFVHLRRDSDGKRRLIEVAEMVGFDGEDYKLNYIYSTDSEGRLIDTGNKLINRGKLVQNGFEEGV
ncbi:CpaF family protein [Mogibacterium pumilum]|uniref:Pilus assembly protein n=1 Tax=Mogibacterium pumilum TaxID=86332 RepID=A0A223ASK2_9FIRM|nr:ATPase, T2SS/T4P/T4SS family [Mogibacterium pumilum]ASS37895.1 pilus assembly protein [Mogibacterium pumilum]